METLIISGEFNVEENLDCIKFIENGYISIPNTLKELTINKLINSKTEDSMTKFEILVTGEDGEDGPYGSGGDGKPGQAGGTVKITVKELVGDVHIKAGGGMGGAGGKGAEGPDGGNGGCGGDGGNGANVEFYYSSQASDSTSYAYALSAKGGMGGKGGSGGSCTGSFGMGGEAGKAGTAGAKFGDGGSGGTNGQHGTITIHHPDGGCSINGVEQRSEADYLDSPDGVRILDLRNPGDYRRLIQSYGGENHLKKYPLIWASIKKTKESAIKDSAFRAAAEEVTIKGSITQITPIGVNNNLFSIENNEEFYDFYQIQATIQTLFGNSSTSLSDQFDEAKLLVPADSMIKVIINEKDTNNTIYETTLYNSGEDIMHSLDSILTDVFPYEYLNGKSFLLTATKTYFFNDEYIISAVMEQECEFKRTQFEPYINQITITDPHWNEGKESGDIMFLYGRTIDDAPPSYKEADYWDNDGPYHKNKFDNGKLGTIIPMSGTISLNNFPGHEVIGASIDSYVTGKGSYSRSNLGYNIQGERQVIAEHRKDIDIKQLGKALQDNNDVKYNGDTNSVTFDLKLPPLTAGKSEYDWECYITGGFLDESSHKCYLRGCFVLNIEHKPRVGSTNDRYQINIFSTDAPPKPQKYYIGAKNSTTVYIPPIVIYWGCYAKETLVKTADGSEMRVDKIQSGDKLCAFGNKILTVSEVLTGSEGEIFKIQTANGNHIRVSAGHGMKLYDEICPEGKRIAARYLKKGDQLMTPGGSQTVEEVLIEDYNDLVYNFIFMEEKKPNYIEANGYWSGDFYAQNEMTEKKEVQRSESLKALADELRRFAVDNQK